MKIKEFIAILFLVINTCCVASASGASNISISNVEANVGANMSLNVNLTANPGISAMKIKINYNANVFTLLSDGVTNGNVFPNSTFTAGPIATNPYTLTWASTGNINTTGSLATLRFKINENANSGQYPISISYYEASNFNEEDVVVSVTDAIITVNKAQTPKISVSNSTGEKGKTVQIAVNIENNPGISAMRLQLSYDATALSLIDGGVANGSVFQQTAFTLGPFENIPYTVSWVETNNITSVGTLATFKFRINNNSIDGDYPITISYCEASNLNEENINFSIQNGNINIFAPVTVYTVTSTIKLTNGYVFMITPHNTPIGSKIITAMYKNNKLTAMQNNVYTGNALNVALIGEADYGKIMVWNSLSSLLPLGRCEAFALN